MAQTSHHTSPAEGTGGGGEGGGCGTIDGGESGGGDVKAKSSKDGNADGASS